MTRVYVRFSTMNSQKSVTKTPVRPIYRETIYFKKAKTPMQNMTIPNHNYLNPCLQLSLSPSAYGGKISVKNLSRSDTKKLCAYVPLSLCAFLPIPINLIKILTVKNSVNQCLKFCISLAPQLVGPTNSENFPLSLFVRNLPKYSKIFKNRRRKLTEIVRN